TEHFRYSHLVFFSRVLNETDQPIKLQLQFSADAYPIPSSPNVFIQLLLPEEVMTMDKQSQFTYGLSRLEHLDVATCHQQVIQPGAEGLFYTVALFYQDVPDEWIADRGGNRAELTMDGQDLYFNLLPQVEALPVGRISIVE
ncbi:MAG: hypothetical protein AAF598_18255, partial [Bacteroidota bacterium]